jgi:hypothetical protein
LGCVQLNLLIYVKTKKLHGQGGKFNNFCGYNYTLLTFYHVDFHRFYTNT